MHRRARARHTNAVNSYLGGEPGQAWEGDLLSPVLLLEPSDFWTSCMYSCPKHFFLPQLCTLPFLTLTGSSSPNT